jgi:hypothetical protein
LPVALTPLRSLRLTVMMRRSPLTSDLTLTMMFDLAFTWGCGDVSCFDAVIRWETFSPNWEVSAFTQLANLVPF